MQRMGPVVNGQEDETIRSFGVLVFGLELPMIMVIQELVEKNMVQIFVQESGAIASRGMMMPIMLSQQIGCFKILIMMLFGTVVMKLGQ